MTASDQNATTDVIPVVFKSLKAARAAGYHDLRDEEYGGEQTQVEGRTLVRDPQVAVSKTAWGERGFRVRRGETPHAEVSGTVGGKNRSWFVYRDDQVEPKRVVRRLEPKRVPLLAAVWTINRTAKRFRDAATRHYRGGRHGFAGDASQRKEMLYARKGQALHHLMADGTLQHAGYHRFPGNKWARGTDGSGLHLHRTVRDSEAEIRQSALDNRGKTTRCKGTQTVRRNLHTGRVSQRKGPSRHLRVAASGASQLRLRAGGGL